MGASFFSAKDLILGAVYARIFYLLAILSGRPNFQFVTERLAVGGVSRPEVEARFVDAVVDLQGSSAQSIKVLDYAVVLVEDGKAPTLEILEIVEKKLREGKRVLVRCKWGRSRSATVVCGVLMRSGMSIRDAVALIKKKRPCVYMNCLQISFLRTLRQNRPSRESLGERSSHSEMPFI